MQLKTQRQSDVEAANILTIYHHLSSQWREFTFWQIANWGDTTREIWGGCQSEEVDANILTISSPRSRSYDVCSGMWWHQLVTSTTTTSSSTKLHQIQCHWTSTSPKLTNFKMVFLASKLTCVVGKPVKKSTTRASALRSKACLRKHHEQLVKGFKNRGKCNK